MTQGETATGTRTTARAAAVFVSSLSIMGGVGVASVWLHPGARGFAGVAAPATVAMCGVGLLGAAALAVWPKLADSHPMGSGLAIVTLLLTVASWWSGPILGPYLSMSYVWVGMGAYLFLRRERAVALVGWIAACYAVLLAVQPGNAAPATRWILVVGVVTVSGLLVGRLADRIHHLVNEEHRLRLEIEEAGRALEIARGHRAEFLDGMSHELRTPLNAIIGFADVLGEHLFGPLTDAQEGAVAQIQSAGVSLLELAGGVLSLDADSAPSDPAGADDRSVRLEHEPLLRADPRGALSFFLLAPLALVALPRTPHGFTVAGVILFVGVGLVLDMCALLLPGIPGRLRPSLHLAVVTLAVLALALSTGPVISPFVTIFVMWIATAASIRLSPRMAMVHLASIAATEFMVVLVQRGNSAPFYRWEVTTVTACVTAIAMRRIVNRLLEAAEVEAGLRRAAGATAADLDATERHKVSFLGNVRRELRLPIGEVNAAAGLLARGDLGPLAPKQAEYAEDILGASRDLWDLITDILDLATLESGRMLIEPVAVDLDALIREVVDLFEPSAVAAGVRMELTLAGPMVIHVDRDQMRRAIASLISNAVKFTPPGGHVAVDGRVSGAQATIEVADSGPGIPLADQARIFEGFQQGRSAAFAPGTGLGLTLASRFVQIQGGHVELESTPGTGSRFTIRCPVSAGASSEPREAPVR